MAKIRRPHLDATWLVPALTGAIVVVVVAAGASAAIESRTVTSYWAGLWWAVSLLTTVGFVGEPPETVSGQVLSAVLMILGFLLLAMVSASLAALFVREEEQPRDIRDEATDAAILRALASLEQRLATIERRLPDRGPDLAGGDRRS